jgi:hypothetical protein
MTPGKETRPPALVLAAGPGPGPTGGSRRSPALSWERAPGTEGWDLGAGDQLVVPWVVEVR